MLITASCVLGVHSFLIISRETIWISAPLEMSARVSAVLGKKVSKFVFDTRVPRPPSNLFCLYAIWYHLNIEWTYEIWEIMLWRVMFWVEKLISNSWSSSRYTASLLRENTFEKIRSFLYYRSMFFYLKNRSYKLLRPLPSTTVFENGYVLIKTTQLLIKITHFKVLGQAWFSSSITPFFYFFSFI